jgi:hypothetical protein
VVWVRAPAGRTVTLRLRERRGSTIVRTTVVSATGTGVWQELGLSSPGAAEATSLSVEVLASLVGGTTAQVDDVSLKRT